MFELEAEENRGPLLESLVRQAGERKSAESVVLLHEFARSSGVQFAFSRFQRVGLIYALVQTGKPVEAFDATVKCFADSHGVPDTAVRMVSQGLAQQVSFVDDAYYLLDSRREAGEPVPLQAVNVVIEACA